VKIDALFAVSKAVAAVAAHHGSSSWWPEALLTLTARTWMHGHTCFATLGLVELRGCPDV
jgi:hypothetical protein